MSQNKFQFIIIAFLIFFLMLPVTGLVPVLQEITKGRFSNITTFEKHLFMSINMIGAFLFAPVIGILSDKINKRKTILAMALLFNATSLYLMSLDLSYSFYLFLRFLEGCAHISALTILMTSATDRIQNENSGKIMGLVGASLSLGVAVGAPLGGILANKSALNIFSLGAYLLIFEFIICLFLFKETRSGKHSNHIQELMSSIRNSPKLIAPYSFTFIDRMTVGFIISSLTLYMRQFLEMAPKDIGISLAIFLVPFSLLTYPSGIISKKFNKFKMMMLGSLLYGFFLMFISIITKDYLWIVMLLCGISSALMFAPSLSLVADLSEKKNKATAMSGFNASGSLGFLLGPIVSGLIVTILNSFLSLEESYQLVFIVCGALELICVLIFLPYIKKFS